MMVVFLREVIFPTSFHPGVSVLYPPKPMPPMPISACQMNPCAPRFLTPTNVARVSHLM